MPKVASFKARARISALLMLVFAGSIMHAQVRIVTGAPAQPSHPLNILPGVTSLENHVGPYMPNVPASVTSISPYNFNTRPYTNGNYYSYGYSRGGYYGCKGRGCGAYGRYGGYGYSYAVPYYYVYPDEGYDTSSISGPYLYSGPPPSQTPPNEQTLHIVVDTAPGRPAYPRDDPAEERPSAPAKQAQADVKPGVPTILVFRDGRKQEVTNYAIMGQTVYIFDNRTKKVALADLDIPATVKANDDQGVEFQLPKVKQNAKPPKSTTVPQSAPDEPQKVPSDLAQSTS